MSIQVPMTLASLAPILSMLFVALGLILPGILKRDGFSNRINQAIAFSIVFVASLATALVQSKLGPDFIQDFALVMTGMHVLLGVDGPFKSLDQFLQSNVNAGAQPAPQFSSWSNVPTAGDAGDSSVPIELQTTLKRPAIKIQNPQAVPVVQPPTQLGG